MFVFNLSSGRLQSALFAVLVLSSSVACSAHDPDNDDKSPDAPLIVAAGANWDEFARIRRGEAAEEKADTKAQPGPGQKPGQGSGSFPAASKAGAAHKRENAPNLRLISAPPQPTTARSGWAYYRGHMNIDGNDWYDPHGVDFAWAYSRRDPLPAEPRIVVHLHGSGGGKDSMGLFGPSPKGDIEVRPQDAEAHNASWREWWSYSADGIGYPGRRIAATVNFVAKRHRVDISRKGLVIEGSSMGGAGAVVQTMILPDPWRSLIAYVTGQVGIIMPRRVAQRDPGQYSGLPPDRGRHRSVWDSMDFSLQAKIDPVVQGIHYRQSFSTDDPFSEGPDGNTQVEFVNLVEQQRIGGAFSWVKAGHWMSEPGVNLPDLAQFESPDQDVTLDRAHPAFTGSTGNYPTRQADRVDEKRFPRGHYNMGLIWKHADIVDEPTQLVFPIRYRHRTSIGRGIPDQPRRITVSVTPRRPSQFQFVEGETLSWSWDGGALTGQVEVRDATVTIDKIPLISGQAYKNLRIYRQ